MKLAVIALLAGSSTAYFSPARQVAGVRPAALAPRRRFAAASASESGGGDGDSSSTTTTVQRLLDAVDARRTEDPSSSSPSPTQPRASADEVSSLFRNLEEAYRRRESADGEEDPFEPLLGLYDVAYVQTEKEGDNPVGGKWTRKGGVAQKILSTRRAFQHLLPTNSTGLGRTVLHSSAPEVKDDDGRSVVAEAVNVVSLDALFGLVRLTVMLRGDAVAVSPEERRACEERRARRMSAAEEEGGSGRRSEEIAPLSARTVRAYFDAPRIVFGRRGRMLNINIGPTSDVVLDTTYCDDQIRVGRGGNSGTRFLFKRCRADDEEANEWKSLLARRPLRKYKALWVLGTVAVFGFWSAVRAAELSGRFCGLLASALATLAAATVLFSAGGIERDDFR